MAQLYEKEVYIYSNAKDEIREFEKTIRREFYGLFKQLGAFGKLSYPEARKLIGHDLFEIRVREDGAYRSIYSYERSRIVILSAFRKKAQKTPKREIEKALKRRSKLNV